MSTIERFVRSQVGKALSGNLAEALSSAALEGGIKEHGWAVAGGLGLDSMAVNLAFLAHSKATTALRGLGGGTAKDLGMFFAAQGGLLQRGIFTWQEADGMHQFTFPMNPESITETLSPVWAESMVPGQNRPLYAFINGGPREVTFTLNFFYQDRRRDTIRNQIEALKSLTQRRYTGTLSGAYDGPPPIRFYFGDYFRGERFIVSKVQVRAFDLFDPRSLLPLRADVSLTLLEAVDTTAIRSRNTLGPTDNVAGR